MDTWTQSQDQSFTNSVGKRKAADKRNVTRSAVEGMIEK